MEKVQIYIDRLDQELSKFPLFEEIEKKTKVPKSYMVLSGAAFLFVLIFFNVAGSLLTNLIGFLYPAYCSFKAIESPDANDDVQWLTYWVVFGFLNIMETFTDILLYWFPLYFTLKTILVIYLVYFRGAAFVYSHFLRPFLLQKESKIDGELNKLKTKMSQSINDFKKD